MRKFELVEFPGAGRLSGAPGGVGGWSCALESWKAEAPETREALTRAFLDVSKSNA